jgi:hypothetical protein
MSELGTMLFTFLSDVNKAQTRAILTEEDESKEFLFNAEPVPEPESYVCDFCNGSGEGMFDGSKCRVCHGHGEVPNENIRREIYEVVDDFDGYDF